MEIVYKNVEDLTPYDKNPRKNEAAIPAVMESIKKFGFKVPCVADKNGVLVTGHTRLAAAKRLGLQQVPVIIADDLSEAEIKAFRLADNKVSEKARWDLDLLKSEIDDLDELQFDLDGFGFDIEADLEKHEEAKEHTQELVENILNLGKGQYYGDNYYDIPELDPVYELPPIKEWIGFNYILSDKNPEGKAVHFFIDDYQFERIWNHPEKYVEKLKQYVCVATPDFSPYGDMPLVCQLFNHYKKHWVGKYLQERGVTVIPTIRCSTDERSKDWYLDGEPKGGIVIISSMWGSELENELRGEFDTMYDTLGPEKIFVYGKQYEWMRGNIERVQSFGEKRWKGDN